MNKMFAVIRSPDPRGIIGNKLIINARLYDSSVFALKFYTSTLSIIYTA